jgi:SAM-dependent methyltransferase
MSRGLLHRIVDGVYELRRRVNSEETFLRHALTRYGAPGATLLDVGCGLGRFHGLVSAAGLSWTGTDLNPATVLLHRERRRNAYLPEDLPPGTFDVLLFSHVIEHMDADALTAFLARYLSRLRPGGIAVFLTPLMHPGFYDDFDHVKPYNPAALRQLLCRNTAQLRPVPEAGVFEELELWLKRDPLFHSHRHGLWLHLINLPATLACVLSGGLIGRLTGYGMVLRKNP